MTVSNLWEASQSSFDISSGLLLPIKICYLVLSLYGKDENYDPPLGLAGSAVSKLAGSLPNWDG